MKCNVMKTVRLCTTRAIFFFFNDTATTEIYTLSLHDALPISERRLEAARQVALIGEARVVRRVREGTPLRSEEHTSELQSRQYLVCRLLLEKKNTNISAMLLEHYLDPLCFTSCQPTLSCHGPH